LRGEQTDLRRLTLLLLSSAFVVSAAVPEATELLRISARITSGRNPTLQDVPIFRIDNAVLYRLPLMTIDLDGAPNAYHPPVPGHPHGTGPGLGLEDLRNASRNLDDGPNADWVGLATDAQGKPFIQETGPFAGFYVSETSLEDSRFSSADPRRYVDATKIPYVVLNSILRKKAGLDVGDLAVVVMEAQEPKIAFGIVADIGPAKGLGECSKALADSLDISSGVEGSDLVYIFFATPKNRKVRTAEEIQSQGEALFSAWGGISRVRELPKAGSHA